MQEDIENTNPNQDEKPYNREQHMLELVGAIGCFIDDEGKRFKDDKDKRDFVLSVVVNLLGNLCIQYSGDSLEEKMDLSKSSVGNLTNWFKVFFLTYIESKKEIH